ncbi:MAG: hypothetical protein J5802_01800, partial [Butyrivibrio sp.]|nr:hypothetical protein [Butyrivibrio sp.]
FISEIYVIFFWSACHCYASELFLLFYQEMARINRDNLIKYQRVSTLVTDPLPVRASMDYDGNGIVTENEIIKFVKDVYGVDYDPSKPQETADAIQQKINEKVSKNKIETKQQTDNSNSEEKKEATTHTHSYSASVTKEATCSEEGEMTYKCSCGGKYTEPIPKKNHNYEAKTTQEPTCTEPGTQTQICTVCGDTIETEIPALGHTPGEWVTEKEATCSEEGRNVRYCSVCGEPVETMVIDKLPHTEGDWEITQKATLTKIGHETKKCAVCGEVLQEEEIPANTTLLYLLMALGCTVLISAGVGAVKFRRKRADT